MSRRDAYDERQEHAYYDAPPARPVRVASPPPFREGSRSERDLPDVYYQRPVEDNQIAFVRDDYRRTERAERDVDRREVTRVDDRRGDTRSVSDMRSVRDVREVRDDQPLVLRQRKVETYARPVRRERSPSVERGMRSERYVERDTRARSESLDSRRYAREMSPEREQVSYRRERYVERERSPSPAYDRERVQTRTRTVERERERSPSPLYDQERVSTRTREVERVRKRSPSPPAEIRRETNVRIVERERQRPRTPSPSPCPSPEPEVVMVPQEPPVVRAPPIHQEIITHHRHIDHGFEYRPVMVPVPVPRAPSPAPLPRQRSPSRVRQEIRETDIDVRTGPGRDAEVDIYQRDTRREEVRCSPSPIRERRRPEFYDDDVVYERDRERPRARIGGDNRENTSLSVQSREMRHSHSTSDLPRLRNDEQEAEYYNRKAEERGRVGEAYNGATKGWEIIDVPPGTERVRLDGVGGASQEITWQKYNGVRRSQFIPNREPERRRDAVGIYDDRPRESTRSSGWERERETEVIRERERDRRSPLVREDRLEVRNNVNIHIDNGRERRMNGPPPPMPRRDRAQWTEITKDLIVREAIEELGYDYEETEFFFYVFQYLRYVRPPLLPFLLHPIPLPLPSMSSF